jgi:protein-tyrosine-phosphatase
MYSKQKIALIQANSGSCYQLAKILHKRGFIVDIINHESHIIKHSKYINKLHIVNSPLEDFSKTCEDIDNLNRIEKYELIVPINDIALEICNKLKDSIDNVLLDNDYKADEFRNKIHLWQTSKKTHTTFIEGEIINSITEYESRRAKFRLPLVLKTKKSVDVIKNRIHKFEVKKCITNQQFDNFIYENINNSPILIQEPISGFGVGFNFFSIEGEIVSYYAHKRITEHNGGGVSSFRKTIKPTDFDLLKISEKLIRQMNWNGIGMLEYRVFNNQAYVIELNGRPWGSMVLGEQSGCNPIIDYIEWRLKKQLPNVKTTIKINEYSLRLKDDIKNNISLAKSNGCWIFIKWLISLTNLLHPRYHIEDLDLSDIIYTYKYWILKSQTKIKKSDVKIMENIDKLDKICFVCYGNINRSPFAEALFKKEFPEMECISTGLINKSNRMASRQAIIAARKFSIELSNHKSTFIKEHDLKGWKIIVMDDYNIDLAIKMGLNKNELYKISSGNIDDPHLTKDLFFEKVFESIYKLIMELKFNFNK